MAKMLGVWINVQFPNLRDELYLQVGGTIILRDDEVPKLAEKLMNVQITVMDDDTFSDDVIMRDSSFSVGIHDTNPHCFVTTVRVPRKAIEDSEPFWDSYAELYCKVKATGGGVTTNERNSQIVNVAI
jgi:hypothetical protein